MKDKIPVKILDIEGDGYHLMIKARINGKPAKLIVDTGASRTVFDKTRIKRFLKEEEVTSHDRLSTGLGTSNMQSEVVELGYLQLGKFKLYGFPAVLLDLSHVISTYEAIGLDPVDGVLGSDVLLKGNGIIDFGKRSITLELKESVKRKVTPRRSAKSAKKKKAVSIRKR